MRLLIVRHADPNYEIDSLTETGWKEAELLSNLMKDVDVDSIYVSPFGRAKDTASVSLKKMNRTAETLDWLREFQTNIHRPDQPDKEMICWDWLPGDWTKEPMYYDVNTWADTDVMKEGNVKAEYQWVCSNLDDLLARHGYVREENYYRAENPNNDTIVFFCHFGVGCVILSHLLNVSPMILWHGLCAAPSSVTTVYTEERREGIASFRVASYGETSHLYVAGEKPSFAARFCECYSNEDERHD